MDENPPRLHLIGTGHVFRIGPTIKDAILALRPGHVFVELDPARLQALRDKAKGEAPTKGGFVQKKLAAFQEGIAGMYGANVGEEMVAAVDAAQMVGAKLWLIDRDARVTLKRAVKQVTWKQRFKLVGQLVGGSIKNITKGKTAAKAQVESDIKRYTENPGLVMEELQRDYPSIHRVVLEERDELMSNRIRQSLPPGEVGVAIVGDGHVDGMIPRLEGLELTTYRLADVRQGNLPKPSSEDFSFGFTVQLG